VLFGMGWNKRLFQVPAFWRLGFFFLLTFYFLVILFCTFALVSERLGWVTAMRLTALVSFLFQWNFLLCVSVFDFDTRVEWAGGCGVLLFFLFFQSVNQQG